MRASERTARSHERPRSTLLSEGRFDPPHATAPGHDAVGVAQREADPREPSARPATSDRPAAQNGVAAAPRLITNAPNASPRRDPNTADGGSRRVGARFEPTRRRQAARRARGQDGSGPGVCPCSAARASRPRRAKGVVAASAGPADTRRFGESLHDSIEDAAKNYLGTGVPHGRGKSSSPLRGENLIDRYQHRRRDRKSGGPHFENWA